jgi:hypothetical protein
MTSMVQVSTPTRPLTVFASVCSDCPIYTVAQMCRRCVHSTWLHIDVLSGFLHSVTSADFLDLYDPRGMRCPKDCPPRAMAKHSIKT